MLYRFIVTNFESFKNQAELSLIPNSGTVRHVVGAESPAPVLKSALIYGANASGKSNFVEAIAFSRDVIKDNDIIETTPNLAYKIDGVSTAMPSAFVYELKLDEDGIYQYGFAMSFKHSRVLEEWLVRKNFDGTETTLFSKQYDENSGSYNIELIASPDDVTATRYGIYRADWQQTNDLLLSRLVEKDLAGDYLFDVCTSVYRWFDAMTVIFPTSEFQLLGALVSNHGAVNELYQSYFKDFDIDIDEIRLVQYPIEFLSLTPAMQARIKSQLKREGSGAIMLHRPGNDYVVELDDVGDLRASEVKFVHSATTGSALLSKDEESDGTNRLVDLIPMLSRLSQSGATAIIDEVDRSLHCLLTREFLRQFYRRTAENTSQLLCTTHDVTLLDTTLVNREEIWFVDKHDGESRLYPLNRYEIPADQMVNLAGNYLLGRFNATPRF